MSSTASRRLRRSALKEAELPSAPREMRAIEEEHNKALFKAGSVQYHIQVLETELEQLNNLLLQLNREAAARAELDKKLASKESKQEEVDNGQPS